MNFFKSNILKIIIVFLVLLSSAACAYSLYNNKGNSSTSQNGIEQRGGFQGQLNQRPASPNQNPGGPSQFPSKGQQGKGQSSNFNAGEQMGHQKMGMQNANNSTATKYEPFIIAYGAAFFI